MWFTYDTLRTSKRLCLWLAQHSFELGPQLGPGFLGFHPSGFWQALAKSDQTKIDESRDYH